MVNIPTKRKDTSTHQKVKSKKPLCIGIVGSRRRNTANDMVECVAALDVTVEKLGCQGNYTLVSGGCEKGADSFAEAIAKTRGLTITIHYPDWTTHLRGAGIVRNTKIADQCDFLIALVAEDRKGGTEDTITKCLWQGKPVLVVDKAWVEAQREQVVVS